jgi:hypothetical protein
MDDLGKKKPSREIGTALIVCGKRCSDTAFSSENNREKKENNKYKEQHFSNAGSTGSYPAKTKYGGNDSDNKKNN